MTSNEMRNDPLFTRNAFDRAGKWDIPLIKKQHLPASDVWALACSQTRSVESEHFKRFGVHFFVDDYRFCGIYDHPDRSFSKYAQYSFLFSPDYSLYADMPRWKQLENVAKNRWCGAYWQSKGKIVIPTISWSDTSSYSFCFDGIERNASVAVGMMRVICEYLDLPRGTYYNYKRAKTKIKVDTVRDETFRPLIKSVFQKSGERFSAAAIRHKLKTQGFEIGVKRIKRLMEEMNLVPISRRNVTFYYNPSSYGRKNKLKRQFTQTEPNKAWVSDITYIFLDGKQYYLCVVIDLFSRKVISFKLSDSAPAALVCETAKTAYAKRGKPEGVLFHSDLGTQYTAYEFFNLVKELKFEQSFSRPGTPFDNAVAESFFATFKKEELYHKEYKSFDELKRGVREYIKYYNNYRPHQKNGYLSPTEFENDYFSRKSGSSGQ